MIIGDRLRTLREEKRLSQGDIEKRTGLLRCYGDKPPALPKSAKCSTEDSLESSRSGALLMRKLLPLLAKMSQDDRNLLFMAGRVSKKQGGMKAGRKLASSAAA